MNLPCTKETIERRQVELRCLGDRSCIECGRKCNADCAGTSSLGKCRFQNHPMRWALKRNGDKLWTMQWKLASKQMWSRSYQICMIHLCVGWCEASPKMEYLYVTGSSCHLQDTGSIFRVNSCVNSDRYSFWGCNLQAPFRIMQYAGVLIKKLFKALYDGPEPWQKFRGPHSTHLNEHYETNRVLLVAEHSSFHGLSHSLPKRCLMTGLSFSSDESCACIQSNLGGTSWGWFLFPSRKWHSVWETMGESRLIWNF